MPALLLDLDGTLIDSRDDLAASVNHALGQLSLPLRPKEEIVSFVGDGMRALLEKSLGPAYLKHFQKAKNEFLAYYKDHCLDKTTPYEGVSETLRELSKKVKMAVVTNKPHRFAVHLISKLGWTNFIKCVVGGDSLEEKKPHPAPLKKALHDLNEPTEHSIMIGDGFQDIRAGIRAGLRTCAAQYGFGFTNAVLDLRPTYQIHHFSEVKEIVQ